MNATTHFFTSTIQASLRSDPWSDEMLALWVPILFYWVYSISFHFLMKAEIPFFEQYRIHTSSEMDKRNRVSITKVLYMVAFQQVIQVILGILVFQPVDQNIVAIQQVRSIGFLTDATFNLLTRFSHSSDAIFKISSLIASTIYWAVIPAFQFVIAMVILDAHQYFFHRLFHVNKFLYRHIHSHHHRLYVPYAFGALYNHPVEGFMLDSVGATLAVELTRMSPRLSMIFFTFSTLKTVDDHCGYALPWDPLQFLFGNNVEYHDIHHQPYGIKKNFSQPFFTIWDKLFDTELSVQQVKASRKTKKVE
ncbi:hypothetical protein CLU79DRAFT_755465 [Phycomyces nitens]|nr:hypothetical protein CLU79DRAFT_755465 [Phycomyces nitens]